MTPSLPLLDLEDQSLRNAIVVSNGALRSLVGANCSNGVVVEFGEGVFISSERLSPVPCLTIANIVDYGSEVKVRYADTAWNVTFMKNQQAVRYWTHSNKPLNAMDEAHFPLKTNTAISAKEPSSEPYLASCFGNALTASFDKLRDRFVYTLTHDAPTMAVDGLPVSRVVARRCLDSTCPGAMSIA